MWILPSKDRAARCQKSINSLVACGATGKIALIANGADRFNIVAPDGSFVTYDELRPAPALNEAFKHFPNEPWYGLWTDDFEAKTLGFEQRMIDAAGKDGIAAANDLWQGEIKGGKVSGCFVIGGDLVRAVGYMAIDGLRHSFIDDMWGAIGYALDRVTYLPDVIVEHQHAWNKKAAPDEGYKRNYYDLERDERVFKRWKAREFPALVARLANHPRVNLSACRLMIATPSIDARLCSAYVISLSKTWRLLMQHGVDVELFILDKCSVLHHARNRLVSKFLQSACTHLLFIDDDMGWPEYAPLELMAHDKDIIAAVGRTKEDDPPTFCVRWSKDTLKYDNRTGLMRVDRVGTGFMLIARRCLERMSAAYQDRAYHDALDPQEMIAPVFWADTIGNELIGEDFLFCDRWRALGGEIWIDPSITIEHVGHHTFVGNYAETLKALHGQRDAAA